MIVGRPIMDENGRMLLSAGQVIKERYVRRIQELKIPMVYIDDQLGVEDSAPLVRQETISDVTRVLKQSYQQFIKSGKTDLKLVKCQIDNIIDDMADNNNLLVGMADLKSHDDYTYQHCVNVCVLAIMLGLSNGYNRSQLQDLGVGAIMHDIGKVLIPLEILNKPDALNDEEYSIIKRHPIDGFRMISNSSDISPVSARATLQHHERLDGTGYPIGVHGEDIHEYGLIVATADVFDALVSDRPYRPACNNHEAMNIVEQGKGSHLSPQFVDILSQHINPLPPGTVVTLSTGDVGIVSQENLKEFRKPQVRLLFNPQNQVYDTEYLVDLATFNSINISKIYSNADTAEVICRYLSSDSEASQAE